MGQYNAEYVTVAYAYVFNVHSQFAKIYTHTTNWRFGVNKIYFPFLFLKVTVSFIQQGYMNNVTLLQKPFKYISNKCCSSQLSINLENSDKKSALILNSTTDFNIDNNKNVS